MGGIYRHMIFLWIPGSLARGESDGGDPDIDLAVKQRITRRATPSGAEITMGGSNDTI